MLNRGNTTVMVRRSRKRGLFLGLSLLLVLGVTWSFLNMPSIIALPDFDGITVSKKFETRVEIQDLDAQTDGVVKFPEPRSASQESPNLESQTTTTSLAIPAIADSVNSKTEIIVKTNADEPESADANTRTIIEAPQPVEDLTALAANWEKRKVRRGDTLGRIFNKLQLSSSDAVTIAGMDQAQVLRKLKPGDELHFGFDDEGQFTTLRYLLDVERTLVVRKQDEEFIERIHTRELEIRQQIASSRISSSLFKAGSGVGLPDRLIMDLVSIFGWDIDFALDLRRGDEFTIVYEEKFWKGEKITTGNILAAEFINVDKTFRAIRHEDDSHYVTYYTPAGKSLRRTFLKTPVEFSRITSGFQKKRFHPLLKKWRAHNGIDYSAPGGTPILATADGKVNFIGRKGGYGKAIVLKHGGKYSTLYAHMSKYKSGIRRNQTVRQGDVIGYVGQTGLATGPHLHYEFRIGGVHKNPLNHKQPDTKAIDDKYREEFESLAAKLTAQIDIAKVQKVAVN